jgi:electron transport complex protein RnfG
MAKKESSFVNMVVTLVLVTAIAGFALGGVYELTKEPIAAAKKAKLENALSNVLPEFDKITEQTVLAKDGKDNLTFYNASLNGEYVGTAVRSYTDKGFSGRFWIMVGFDTEKKIVNTAVLEHKETPGLGDKMEQKKHPWSLQFNGKNPFNDYSLVVTKDGGDVDAITAATISSRAFCEAIQRAVDNYEQKDGGAK